MTKKGEFHKRGLLLLQQKLEEERRDARAHLERGKTRLSRSTQEENSLKEKLTVVQSAIIQDEEAVEESQERIRRCSREIRETKALIQLLAR